jgi:FkbH-like protein
MSPTHQGYKFWEPARQIVDNLNFPQLDLRARAIAAQLQESLKPRDRVILTFPPGIEFIAAFFGCLYAGGIAVPTELGLPNRNSSRLQAIIADSQPALALTNGEHEGRVRSLVEGSGLTCMASDIIPSSDAAHWKPVAQRSDDLAYLQYTSGSTAAPKGVMISHACVLANLADIDSQFAHDQNSVSVSWLPHFHDMGLVYGILQPIYNGFTAVLLSPRSFIQNPFRWLEAISLYRATHSGGPDFGYAHCVNRIKDERRSELDLSSWRVAFVGAEPVRQQTMETFRAKFHACNFDPKALHPAYGLAEATLKVTSRSRTGAMQFRSHLGNVNDGVTYASCGIPGSQTRLVIVDSETGAVCEPGKVGEVWVKSPSVAAGYWQKPEESARQFQACIAGANDGGYLRTGDLGFLSCGELHITGRLKDVVIIRGQNRHPEDIESVVVRSHPSLLGRRCAAFGIDVNGFEGIVVALESAGQSAADEALFPLIRQSVGQALELRIDTIVLTARGVIPVTSSGKTCRIACREAWLASNLPAIISDTLTIGADNAEAVMDCRFQSSQADVLEGQLRKLLSQSLGIHAGDIPANEPLIGLGLDSLAAAEVQVALETTFGLICPMENLLGSVTLEDLVSDLQQSGQLIPGRQTVTVVDKTTAQPTYLASFFQERLWFIQRLFNRPGILNLTKAIRLRGPVQINRLRRALDILVERQESLRTAFRETDDGLIAFAVADLKIEFTLADLSRRPPNQREIAYTEIAREMAAVAIDPSQAPLWKATLVQLAAEEFILVVSLSHLISDASSLDIFERQLASLYADPNHDIGLKAGYGDFARWHRGESTSPRLLEQVVYWANELESAAPLKWPRISCLQPEHRVVRLELGLDKEELKNLQSLAQGESVTIFTLLLGAFQIAVAWYTEQTDFVISFPVDYRPRPEFSGVIGCFANRLAARARINGDVTLREYLQYVRSTVLRALDNRDASLRQVKATIENMRLAEGPDALSQALFQLQWVSQEAGSNEIEVEANYVAPPFLLFDLFALAEISDRLSFTFLFNGDHFDEAAAARFLRAYAELLQNLHSQLPVKIRQLQWPLKREYLDEAEAVRIRIDVVANFVADGIGESLNYWLPSIGGDYLLWFAPFNQVLQYLFDPSLLPADRNGVSVLLIQVERWLASWDRNPDSPLPPNLIDFADALQGASRRATKKRFLVLLCPPSPDFREDAALVEIESRLSDLLNSCPGVEVITHQRLLQLYPIASYTDPYTDMIGQIPYTRLGFASLGTMVARRIWAMRNGARKVIVTDCDNTLWTGIVGEDGTLGVRVDEHRVVLQRFLLEQSQGGRLLCICSKNYESDVLETLERHPDMLLRREHFTAWRINWRSKCDNLRELAAELNLGIDSFIFIDDNPIECAHMREMCPEVLTLELPADHAQIGQFLNSEWGLDLAGATVEDRNRARFYHENAKRSNAQQTAPTLEDFLGNLGLVVSMRTIEPDDIRRAAQLTERTNQFNLNGLRQSESDVRALMADPVAAGFIVRAQDRFGDYGTVGLSVYLPAPEENALLIERLLLSCRALGKRIEHRMILRLAELANSAGLRSLEFRFIDTGKNGPLKAFMNEIGARPKRDRWQVDVRDVIERCNIALRPFSAKTQDASLQLQ